MIIVEIAVVVVVIVIASVYWAQSMRQTLVHMLYMH